MDEDVSADVMAATYRALCERGYADLTMQDIADRSDRSKAALHYHYDSKRSLLLAFLDYLYEEFVDDVDDPAGDTPAERLRSFVELVLTPPGRGERTDDAFATAILELKAQAPYDDAVRERLQAFDAFLVERIGDYLRAGVEAGEFHDVDPDEVARFIVTAMDGARTKQVAIGQDVARTRRLLQSYIDTLTTDDDAVDGRVPPG